MPKTLTVDELDLTLVHANPQDRKEFDEASLKELAESIRLHGLAQPITVRPDGDGYLIVAGERRFRAHLLLGVKKIKAIVSEMSDEEASAIQLIENVQRVDLDPLEEAMAYQTRMERHGLSDDEVAEWSGKPVTVVRARLMLLLLAPEFLPLVQKGTIGVKHATTMARLDHDRQRMAWEAYRRQGGMVYALWEKLCDELFAEQQQGSMFDNEDFLRLDEHVAKAKSKAKVTLREMQALIVSMSEVLDAVARHYGESVLPEVGVTVADVEKMVATANRVKAMYDGKPPTTKRRVK